MEVDGRADGGGGEEEAMWMHLAGSDMICMAMESFRRVRFLALRNQGHVSGTEMDMDMKVAYCEYYTT